jgi:hypothetical protein
VGCDLWGDLVDFFFAKCMPLIFVMIFMFPEIKKQKQGFGIIYELPGAELWPGKS